MVQMAYASTSRLEMRPASLSSSVSSKSSSPTPTTPSESSPETSSVNTSETTAIADLKPTDIRPALAQLTTRPPSTAAQQSSSSSRLTSSGAVRRRPIPRKGHTKSRKGCLNCKRRRVKCSETTPECDHCMRLGLSCEWPAGMLTTTTTSAAPMSPVMVSPSHTTPTDFSMTDFRFFHHFINGAHPTLPFNGKAIWMEVASMSHDFKFLMHAALGLSASHLTLMTNKDYSARALEHRVMAIQALNESLNKPLSVVSKEEGDARFAAVMALTFQSSYMPEGMYEYLGMLRGCTIVAMTAVPNWEASIFGGNQMQPKDTHTLDPKSENGALARAESGEAIRSLKQLAPLCTRPIEIMFRDNLEQVVALATTSYMNAFALLCGTYQMLGQFDGEEWSHFISKDNSVAQMLLAHYFLIEYSVAYLNLHTILGIPPIRRPVVATWMRALCNTVHPDYEEYMKWPIRITQILCI